MVIGRYMSNESLQIEVGVQERYEGCGSIG